MDLGIKSHQDSIESISHSGISMWPTVAFLYRRGHGFWELPAHVLRAPWLERKRGFFLPDPLFKIQEKDRVFQLASYTYSQVVGVFCFVFLFECFGFFLLCKRDIP